MQDSTFIPNNIFEIKCYLIQQGIYLKLTATLCSDSEFFLYIVIVIGISGSASRNHCLFIYLFIGSTVSLLLWLGLCYSLQSWQAGTSLHYRAKASLGVLASVVAALMGSWALECGCCGYGHGISCSAACGIVQDQGSSLCPQ